MMELIIKDLDNTDGEELKKLYAFLDENNWLYEVNPQEQMTMLPVNSSSETYF
jgi:hypothetical protein